MILREFLLEIIELIEENPDALNLECFTEESASGSISEVSYPFIAKVSDWDNSEYPLSDMLPNTYEYDSIIRICVGN